jgi:glutathione S-transferase
MPTVYYHPVSQPSRAVHWFVTRHNIKDIEFKVVDILSGATRTEEYLAMTRKYGAVPVLEVDGEILTESGAILTYLSKTHGHVDLPTDLFKEARVNEALLHHDGLARNVTRCCMKALFAKKANPSLTLADQKNLVDRATLRESLEFVDGILGQWKYIAGAEFTIADYLVAAELTQLQFMKPVLDEDYQVQKFANISRYLKDLESISGFEGFVAPAAILANLCASEASEGKP